jgi:hypothetical protein
MVATFVEISRTSWYCGNSGFLAPVALCANQFILLTSTRLMGGAFHLQFARYVGVFELYVWPWGGEFNRKISKNSYAGGGDMLTV